MYFVKLSEIETVLRRDFREIFFEKIPCRFPYYTPSPVSSL